MAEEEKEIIKTIPALIAFYIILFGTDCLADQAIGAGKQAINQASPSMEQGMSARL